MSMRHTLYTALMLGLFCAPVVAAAAASKDYSGSYVYSDGNSIGTLDISKLQGRNRYGFTIAVSISQPKRAQGDYAGEFTVTDDHAVFHSRETSDCVLRFAFADDKVLVSGDTPKTCVKAKGFTFTHSYRKKYRD